MTAADSISLSLDTAELERLTAFISAFCERKGVEGLDMVLNLVAEEVFMNVVRHGAGASSAAVNLRRDAGAVVMVTEDDAAEFNPLLAPEFDPATPLEQRRTGGLGIHLLRSLMDTVDYQRVSGKNVLTMRKSIPA